MTTDSTETPKHYAAQTGVKVWFDFENDVLCIGFTNNGKTCRFEEYVNLATARELRDKLNQHVAALEALGKAE